MTTAIGIDVGGTTTKGVVLDSDDQIVLRAERPTELQAGTKGILGLVDTLLEQAQARGLDVESIGIGAAGFVDVTRGVMTFSPTLVYDDPEIAEAVRARTSLRTFVDNDANAAAWGEFRLGSAKGVTNLAFLTLGTGIGSGFVVNGRLLRGARGAGAELGHTVVDPAGPRCKCGLKGCLELFASGEAIERLAREATGREMTGMAVAEAARKYDETAREVLRIAGSSLGVGLSNVVNLFDPQVIVLGGSVVGAGEAYLGPARDRLATMLAAQKRRPVRLDVSSLGKDAGVLGAALLSRETGEAA